MTESDAQAIARILHGHAHDQSEGEYVDAWVVRIPTCSGTVVQVDDDEIRWSDFEDDMDDSIGRILLM